MTSSPPAQVCSPVHAGTMLTDTAGNIEYVDEAFCRTTGYESSQLVGETLDLLQPEGRDPAIVKIMWQTLARDGRWRGAIHHRANNGSPLELVLNMTAVADATGAPSRFVGIYTDPRTLGPDLCADPVEVGRDPLTGLPGVAEVAVRLEQALDKARAEGSGLSLFRIHLKDYADWVDRLGPEATDRLLLRVVEALTRILAPSDILARGGDDQFLFVFPRPLDEAEIEPLASRILELVAGPYELGEETIRPSARIGVTSYPADTVDAPSLLRHADAALYWAGRSGANPVIIYQPRLGRSGTCPHPLRDHLMGALEGEGLTLFYQPIVDLRAGRIMAVEALLRWRDPGDGVISPGEVLADLGDDALMVRIGNWVIRKALADASAWISHGLELSLTVNVAAAQLLHSGFVDHLRAALAEFSQVRPEHLELEILESAALDNLRQVRQVIETCRHWGVRFSLDDFGTGQASLAYLREVPVDVLKIDPSFVADLLDDREARALVEGIVALARGLRRVVVAEGVEDQEHAIVLMRLGCDLVQGFGIARPMPPAELPGWVAEFEPNPQWSLWADVDWEMLDLPLLAARLDHIRWVDKVLGFVEGGDLNLADGELLDHHQCRFGDWYYHHGRERYGHLPEFGRLEEIHRQVHDTGSRIVQYRQAGDVLRARAHSRELLELRERIFSLLAALQESVAEENAREGAQLMSPLAQSVGSDRPGGATVQVLVVSGLPTNIELLSGALADDYQIKFATTGRRAVEMVGLADRPDLVMLDDNIPDLDPHDVCRLLKEHPNSRTIPVIFVSSEQESAAQEAGFAAGAVDFIPKPFDLAAVRNRVRTHVNLKLRSDLLEAQASLDGLTGLPNRRRFEEALELEWRRGARERSALSLMMLDVDHFKGYNDNYGHGAGDECLRQVAGALSAGLSRPGDLVARYGGEEFAMILPGCNLFGAQLIAERVRNMVEAMRIPHEHSSASRYVTVSIGCSTVVPNLDASPHGLLEQADQALYRAKEGGRNRVQGHPYVSTGKRTHVGQ